VKFNNANFPRIATDAPGITTDVNRYEAALTRRTLDKLIGSPVKGPRPQC
jgi:hypothetical protein